MNAPNRNDPCPCGSGKKYKQCCLKRNAALETDKKSALASIANLFQEGISHHQAGRLSQAEAIYKSILQTEPNHPDTLHFLGLIAHQVGQNDLAIELIKKAICFNPSEPMYFTNLGTAYEALDRLEEALVNHNQALTLKPDYADALGNKGVVFYKQGKLQEAIDFYRRAISLKSEFHEALSHLGIALHDLGKLDSAINYLNKALRINPNYAEAYKNLGFVLANQGKIKEAIEHYLKAIKLKPDLAEAHSNLGSLLQSRGKLEKAVEHLSYALLLKPNNGVAHNSIGLALMDQGLLDEAVGHFNKALSLKLYYASAYSNLMFLFAFNGVLEPRRFLPQARNFEQACLTPEQNLAARQRTFTRTPLEGRRLRVGYVSGDYRQHAVSYFIRQLFALHDRSAIELFAYSANPMQDELTAKLQTLVDHWVPVMGLSDAKVCEQIEEDGIDVLIDLSGHTGHNRLGVFARRAAPVQAHYLGFMGSTGLTEMDYWIGDGILTPGETDSHFSEQVWRLPRVWVCYDAKNDAPDPVWQPDSTGTLWLGSFNNLGKLTATTLDLWAQVLRALPQAKLLLKTKELNDTGNRQRILAKFFDLGILPERIELQDNSATLDWSAHMAYYNRLDIALDPAGAMAGGTTTCDALWMGVPVITREGDRMSARMTASMLHSIGHPEWVTQSDQAYIDKVVELAGNTTLRQALRVELRGQMANSPLCDAGGLAHTLEQAYFEMYLHYLAK